MAIKVFAKALMASEDVQSFVRSCRLYASGDPAALFDGAFVTLGDLDKDGVYGANSTDYNIHKAALGAASAGAAQYVVDLAEIEQGTIGGNTYKIGVKTAGLTLPAGENARARKLVQGDKFWIGEGNFTSGAPTIGSKYSPDSNGTLVVDADTGTIKVIDAKTLVTGQQVFGSAPNYEKLYLCEVL